MGSAAWMLVHLGAFALLGAVALFGYDGSLFFWHPFCMALYLLLQLEAVLAFKGAFHANGAGAPLNERVALHFWLQTLAALSAAVGFGVIYYNKARFGKPHFISWHAYVGLAALAGTASAYCFGWLLDPRDNRFLRGLVGLKRLKLCYRVHGWFGALTVATVAAACVAALWVAPSHGWAMRKFGGTDTTLRAGLTASVAVATLLALFTPASTAGTKDD